MRYYMKVLQPDETVRYVGKLHWIIYGYAIMFGILAVVVTIFSFNQAENQRPLLLIGAGILALLAAGCFVRSWFRQWTTETVVTDKRIIHKLYFISRWTQEMNISKIETIDVNQTFWGRILGYGTVRAVGTGATLETLPHLASPLQFRNAIVIG